MLNPLNGNRTDSFWSENIPCDRACSHCHARWVEPKATMAYIDIAVCSECVAKNKKPVVPRFHYEPPPRSEPAAAKRGKPSRPTPSQQVQANQTGAAL